MERNAKRKSLSPIANASKQFSRDRSTRIDPHVYCDTQSSGLVSRLVRYHDDSQSKLEKSRSYNKYGQFPLVHLQKKEIKLSPKRQISRSASVRIAPPNKTIFNRDARATILRSNSLHLGSLVVPKLVPTVLRSNDGINRSKDEPIMNDDLNYTHSSKSVLDALKEISRKRINNEEMTLDRTKKHCIPVPSIEKVDGILENRDNQLQVKSKRSREELSPLKNNTKNSQTDHVQTLKKFRSKNNALLSSLSSTQYKELPKVISPKILHTTVSSSSVPVPTLNRSMPVFSSQRYVSQNTSNLEGNKTEMTSVMNTTSDPLLYSSKLNDTNQKKLRLFDNPTYNKSRISFNDDGNDDDDDDEPQIKFVKPRKEATEVNSGNEIIRNVEKSKLSVMLNGISGQLDVPQKNITEQSMDMTDMKSKVATTKSLTPIIIPNTIITDSENNQQKSIVNTAVTSTAQEIVKQTVDKPKVAFSFGSTTTDNNATNVITTPKIQLPISTTVTSIPSIVSTSEMSGNSLPIMSKMLPVQPKTTVSGLALFSSSGIETTSSSSPLPGFTLVNTTTNSIVTPTTKLTSTITPAKVDNFTIGQSQNGSGGIGGFTFGTKKTDVPVSGIKFGLQTSNSNNNLLIGNAIQTESTKNVPIIGSTQINNNNNNNNNVISTTLTQQQPSTIGITSNNQIKPSNVVVTKASGIGFSFNAGNVQTTSTPSLFSTVQAKTTTSIAQIANVEQKPSMFAFGQTSALMTPTSNAINSPAVFGSSQTSQQNKFPFFGTNTTNVKSLNTTFSSTGNNLISNQMNASNVSSTITAPTSAIFGVSAPTNIFSSISNNSGTNSSPFGGVTQKKNEQATTNNMPTMFGLSNVQQNNNNNNNATPAKNIFAFGGKSEMIKSNVTTTTNTNNSGIFGFQGTTVTAAPTFGMNTNTGSTITPTASFTFTGAGNQSNNNQNPVNTQSMFGAPSSTTAPTTNLFQFGGNNNATNVQSTAPKPFAFGGSSQATSSNNAFGSGGGGAASNNGFNFSLGNKVTPSFTSVQPITSTTNVGGSGDASNLFGQSINPVLQSGIFTIGTNSNNNNNNNNRRQIRTATRRIK